MTSLAAGAGGGLSARAKPQSEGSGLPVDKSSLLLEISSFPQINLAYPPAGTQKKLEVFDEQKLQAFYEKRLGEEVEGDALGEEFKGYVLKITGGQDKEGFPMKLGVLKQERVRLLLRPGEQCMRGHALRYGASRRKSVRGCIISHANSVINCIITKVGEKDIEGLTDTEKPRLRGPKRASKIRRLFNLSKSDDVRQYAFTYARQYQNKHGKTKTKVPNIQRLVTPHRLQRKRRLRAKKREQVRQSKKEAEKYEKLLQQRLREQRERRDKHLQKKHKKEG